LTATRDTWQAAATYPVVKSRSADGGVCFNSFDCYILVRQAPKAESEPVDGLERLS
jgi:hypothetical protein